MDVFKKGTTMHEALVTLSALQVEVGPEEKLWRNATGQMAKGIQCGTEVPKEVNSNQKSPKFQRIKLSQHKCTCG
jgi:hypothetical protein